MVDAGDGIDCNAVVEQLYTFLDGELTQGRRVEIMRHLTGCVDCHEVVDFHAEFKLVISAKCRDQVPDQLRQRIIDALGRDPRQGPGMRGL